MLLRYLGQIALAILNGFIIVTKTKCGFLFYLQTRKHCFLATSVLKIYTNQETLFPRRFPECRQTRKHCFLAMFPAGRKTRKHYFLAMFIEGRQTRKYCLLATFYKD